MSAQRTDRVELQGGIVHLPAEFREVARLANQAGLEGWRFVDADMGLDTEAARIALRFALDSWSGDGPEIVSRVEITYERTMFTEAAKIAGAEYEYWKGLTDLDPWMRDMAMSAMGAAANIVAALMMGKTLDQWQREIAARAQTPASAVPGDDLAGGRDGQSATPGEAEVQSSSQEEG